MAAGMEGLYEAIESMRVVREDSTLSSWLWITAFISGTVVLSQMQGLNGAEPWFIMPLFRVLSGVVHQRSSGSGSPTKASKSPSRGCK